jgi:hypothetical protein
MPGAAYDALQDKKQSLIMKARKGSVFGAASSADHIETLTDPTSKLLAPLPLGYKDLGWMSDDGAQFSTDIDTSDVSSWGSTSPTRTDITAESLSLEVAIQETNLMSIGLYAGVASSGITAAANGEVKVVRPLQPVRQQYHLLSLAVDENAAGEIYIARYWPNAMVTDKGDQAFSSGDDPIIFDITFSARPDDDFGSTEAWFFGGPGWMSILDDLGITPASA